MKIFFLLAVVLMSSPSIAQKGKPQKHMSSNKELVSFITNELFNKGDTSIAKKYFVPAFANEEVTFTLLIRKAFPDLVIKIEEQIEEETHIAVRWTATGTHQADFLGVPASGKKVSWKGSWFWTIENGKITDGMGKGSWDALGLIKQLQTE